MSERERDSKLFLFFLLQRPPFHDSGGLGVTLVCNIDLYIAKKYGDEHKQKPSSTREIHESITIYYRIRVNSKLVKTKRKENLSPNMKDLLSSQINDTRQTYMQVLIT